MAKAKYYSHVRGKGKEVAPGGVLISMISCRHRATGAQICGATEQTGSISFQNVTFAKERRRARWLKSAREGESGQSPEWGEFAQPELQKKKRNRLSG